MTSPGVDVARQQSVQAQARLEDDQDLGSVLFWNQSGRRNTILDGTYPSPSYDKKLRDFVYQEGNDFIQGVNASVATRLSGFSWVITGKRGASHFQDVLQEADLGRGWDNLIDKTAQDFVTTNMGMVIELTGDGDVAGPLEGPVTGIAHLDSARCWPTGNLDFPVLYSDPVDGQWHRLHWSRVFHQSDFPSANVDHRGYGWCAVSRCLASANILVELSKYKKEKLDDGPVPGLVALQNITYNQFEKARTEYEHERRNSGYQYWSPLMPLFALDPTKPIGVDITEFTSLPDWFNQREEYEIFVRLVANAYGLDVQDIWTLGGAPLGSGMQSEVLHQKARGKLIRKLIKIYERFINQRVLPPNLTHAFDAQDIEEEKERAATDGAYIDNAIKLVTLGLPRQNALRILVEQQVIDEEDMIEEVPTEVADDVQQEPEDVGGPEGDIAIEEDKEPEDEAPTNSKKVTPALARKQTAAFNRIKRAYFTTLRNLTKDAIAGRLRRGATYNRRFRRAIDESYQGAWGQGFTDGGVTGEMEDEERARLREIINIQREHLGGLSRDLYASIAAMPSRSRRNQLATWQSFESRINMWVTSLIGAYNEAIAMAQGNRMMEWVLGPTEHCRTCLAAAGQRHRANQWLRSGIMPQSDTLECGGFNCQCELRPTDQRARGRLSRIPRANKQYGKALRLAAKELRNALYNRTYTRKVLRSQRGSRRLTRQARRLS